jgi:tetratricopeptide (TPR) repeat protein
VGRSGLTGRASQAWLTALKSGRSQDDLEIFRGEQALARGEIDLGVDLLRKGLYDRKDQDYLLGGAMVQLGRESLAAALEKRGETQNAIAVLEEASQGRARYLSAMGVSPAYWTRNRYQLAWLYRKTGREAEARAIEAELLKLLAFADADHPILVALKASRGTAVSSSVGVPGPPGG